MLALTREYEAELVSRCLKQEMSAEEVLYQHFFSYVFTLIRKFTTNDEETEELTNDCFVKVFKKLKRYDQREMGLKFWIRKIAINTAIDHYRIRKRSPFTRDLPENFDVSTEDVNRVNDLTDEDVFNMLHQLPNEYRMVYVLYEVEGYTHKEIAGLTRITAGNSRMILSRAKASLRAIYKRDFS